MATSPLASKLRMKSDLQVALITPPANYMKEISPLPSGVKISRELKGKYDWIQLFVKTKAELDKLAPRAIRALKPESVLWVSFPKGSSKIQTDLTRDKGWETLLAGDLKWITLISVNDTWSAFGFRPYRSGEKRQSFR